MEALQRIIKDRNYHANQLEANLLKIKEKYEAIVALEQSNIREQKLVDEYNQIIDLIKMDSELQLILPKEKQLTDIIEEVKPNDNLLD
jgi:hypothetical protein